MAHDWPPDERPHDRRSLPLFMVLSIGFHAALLAGVTSTETPGSIPAVSAFRIQLVDKGKTGSDTALSQPKPAAGAPSPARASPSSRGGDAAPTGDKAGSDTALSQPKPAVGAPSPARSSRSSRGGDAAPTGDEAGSDTALSQSKPAAGAPSSPRIVVGIAGPAPSIT